MRFLLRHAATALSFSLRASAQTPGPTIRSIASSAKSPASSRSPTISTTSCSPIRARKPYFEDAPIKRIKQKLVEQFCVLLGGPCEYTGRTMKRSHEGQNIDRAAFNALVEDLQDAMDKNGVPFHAQNKLLAKLAPMYRDVQDRE